MFRGFGMVAHTVKRFLEMHGYNVHLGAWVDIKIGDRLVFDFQIGVWHAYRPPRRGVPCAIYLVSEGRIPRYAREWLKGYDYIFAQSMWVKRLLEEIDLDSIYMPVGIDTELFRPLGMYKWIDVLSIGIWESSWDNRKFMDKVSQVAFPYTHYVHTRPTLRLEDLPLLYNQAKVFLSLTGCEGFGIPPLEANACGLPVVYNDAPAVNEHTYGIAVKPRRVYEVCDRGYYMLIHEPDLEAIRRELHRLLQDPKRIERMGREARLHALQYDYRKTYKPLLEVLPRP